MLWDLTRATEMTDTELGVRLSRTLKWPVCVFFPLPIKQLWPINVQHPLPAEKRFQVPDARRVEYLIPGCSRLFILKEFQRKEGPKRLSGSFIQQELFKYLLSKQSFLWFVNKNISVRKYLWDVSYYNRHLNQFKIFH